MLTEVLEEIENQRNRIKEREIFKEACTEMKDLCDEVDDLITQIPEDHREERVMLLIIYLISHIKLRQAVTLVKDIPELLKTLSARAITDAPEETRDELWKHIKEVNKTIKDKDEQCKD